MELLWLIEERGDLEKWVMLIHWCYPSFESTTCMHVGKILQSSHLTTHSVTYIHTYNVKRAKNPILTYRVYRFYDDIAADNPTAPKYPTNLYKGFIN